MKCELVGIVNSAHQTASPGFFMRNEISGLAATDECDIPKPFPFILPINNQMACFLSKKENIIGQKLKITIETIE
jgi:hypothetical protein